MPRTLKEEVFEIVQQMPGVTSGEVAELMPHVKRQSVYSCLNTAFNQGLLTREQGKDKAYHWQWVEGKPVPPVRQFKAAKLSDDTLHVTIQSLRQQVAELQEWKTNAIARFPELAVDPVVLKAREIVARVLRDREDFNSATTIESGLRDSSALVQAVVSTLEGVWRCQTSNTSP